MTSRTIALTLAGDLAMAYPGRNVTEAHAQSWAAEFQALTEADARAAAAALRRNSSDPPSIAQVRQAIRDARGITVSPSGGAHTYLDGVGCWCEEVHGHLIEPEVVDHGIYHLRRYWAGNEDERESMRYPERCACGWKL